MSKNVSDISIDPLSPDEPGLGNESGRLGRMLAIAKKASPLLGAAVLGAITTVVLRRR